MTEAQQTALIIQIDRVMQLRRVAIVMDRKAHCATEQAMQARAKLAAGEVKLATLLHASTMPEPEPVP